MDLKISGKTCLITGASAGCGEGVARLLAHEGVQVVMTARRQDLLESIADDIAETAKVRPEVIVGDITSIRPDGLPSDSSQTCANGSGGGLSISVDRWNLDP